MSRRPRTTHVPGCPQTIAVRKARIRGSTGEAFSTSPRRTTQNVLRPDPRPTFPRVTAPWGAVSRCSIVLAPLLPASHCVDCWIAVSHARSQATPRSADCCQKTRRPTAVPRHRPSKGGEGLPLPSLQGADLLHIEFWCRVPASCALGYLRKANDIHAPTSRSGGTSATLLVQACVEVLAVVRSRHTASARFAPATS